MWVIWSIFFDGKASRNDDISSAMPQKIGNYIYFAIVAIGVKSLAPRGA